VGEGWAGDVTAHPATRAMVEEYAAWYDRAYVERCIATPSEVERTYIIVGRDDNVVRGAFALRQRAAHRLDCGYVLGRQWWRQRLMTEVLTEVTVWALRQPSVFRIGAVCDVEDAGSARVSERCGV